jgi:hypothetical protein
LIELCVYTHFYYNIRYRHVHVLLTHPCRLVDPDLYGEGVVWGEHGGDGRRGVGHADAVRHAAGRHRDGGKQLKERKEKGWMTITFNCLQICFVILEVCTTRCDEMSLIGSQ